MSKTLNIYGIMSDRKIADKKRLEDMVITNMTPDIIEISPSLEIKPLKTGTARIQVSLEAFVNEIILYVRPYLDEVTIEPATITAYLNEYINIKDTTTVTGVLTDGTPAPESILLNPTYSIGDRSVIEVVGDTLIGRSLGQTTLSFKFTDQEIDKTLIKTIDVNVIKNVLKDLIFVDSKGTEITNIYIKNGLSEDVYIKGRMLKGEIISLTQEQLDAIQFIIPDESIANIDHFIAKGYKEGSIPVTAILGDVIGSVNLIVTESIRPKVELTMDSLYKYHEDIPVTVLFYQSDFDVYKKYWKVIDTSIGRIVQEGEGIPDKLVLDYAGDFKYIQYGEYLDNLGNNIISDEKEFSVIAPLRLSVDYSTEDYTEDDVLVELISNRDIIILNNNGDKYYTFTENGDFTFQVQDPIFGTLHEVEAVVNKMVPKLSLHIDYDPTELTDSPVVAMLTSDRPCVILNNGGYSDYVFTDNGTFTFEVYDDLLKQNRYATARVNWIALLNLRLEYDKLSPYGPTIAKVLADTTIQVLNNGGSNEYTFTENGSFTFYVRDIFNKTHSITATVSSIVPPLVSSIVLSPDTFTIGNVTAQLITNRSVTITSITGSYIATDSPDTVEVTDNCTIKFNFTDDATGVAFSESRTINWIVPEVKIISTSYSHDRKTYDNVTVTCKINRDSGVTSNATKISDCTFTHTFATNGSFTFVFTDSISGNTITKTVTVDLIAARPNLSIEYNPDPNGGLLYGPVEAKLVCDKSIVIDDVTFKRRTKSVTWVTETLPTSSTAQLNSIGRITFEYTDPEVGESGVCTEYINFIYSPLNFEITYSETDLTYDTTVSATLHVDRDDTYLTEYGERYTILNNSGSHTRSFTSNGTFTFQIQDDVDMKVYEITATVNNMVVKPQFQLILSKQDLPTTVAPIEAVIRCTNRNNIVFIANDTGETTDDMPDKMIIHGNGSYSFKYKDPQMNNEYNYSFSISNILPKIIGNISYSYTKYKEDGVTPVESKARLTITNRSSSTYEIYGEDGVYSNEHIFKERGEFIFYVKDLISTEVLQFKAVENTILTPIVFTITYDKTLPAIGPVTCTLTSNRPVDTLAGRLYDWTGNSATSIDHAIDVTKPFLVYRMCELKLSYNDPHDGGKFKQQTLYIKDIHLPLKVDVKYNKHLNTYGPVTAKLVGNRDYLDFYNIEGQQVEVINNDGKFQYDFIENGQFVFKVKDLISGKIIDVVASTDLIVNRPKIWIEYNPDTKPIIKPGYVEAKLCSDMYIDVLGIYVNNSNNPHILFSGNNIKLYENLLNGPFISHYFKYIDPRIDDGTTEQGFGIEVDWIYESLYDDLNAVISYSTTSPTYNNVSATLNLNRSETFTVLNNGGSVTHTFTNNGSFTFEVLDNLTNKTYQFTAIVSCIIPKPRATIKFTPDTDTIGSVTAKFVCDKNVTIISNSNNDTLDTITITKNGTVFFKYKDEDTGTTFEISRLCDSIYPQLVYNVTPNITTWTEDPVIYTIDTNRDSKTVSIADGILYMFLENKDVVAILEDYITNEQIEIPLSVSWKLPKPNFTVTYDPPLPTTKNKVIATITSDVPGVKLYDATGAECNTIEFTKNSTKSLSYKHTDFPGSPTYQYSLTVNSMHPPITVTATDFTYVETWESYTEENHWFFQIQPTGAMMDGRYNQLYMCFTMNEERYERTIDKEFWDSNAKFTQHVGIGYSGSFDNLLYYNLCSGYEDIFHIPKNVIEEFKTKWYVDDLISGERIYLPVDIQKIKRDRFTTTHPDSRLFLTYTKDGEILEVPFDSEGIAKYSFNAKDVILHEEIPAVDNNGNPTGIYFVKDRGSYKDSSPYQAGYYTGNLNVLMRKAPYHVVYSLANGDIINYWDQKPGDVVTATIVIDNPNFEIVGDSSHTFSESGTFLFKVLDKTLDLHEEVPAIANIG